MVRDIWDRCPSDVATVLDRLTAAAADDVPGARYAGITTTDDHGRVDTPATAGIYPSLLDAIQKRHQQGPCLQAAVGSHPVLVDDLGTDSRWPDYQRDALRTTPIRSVLSVELCKYRHSGGALNLYAEEPRAFDAESQAVGFIWAAHAGQAWHALRREAEFRSALASRDIIGQAKGMVMERYRIDATAAFGLLRKLSQQSNIPVAEIARRLVEAEHL